jgi:ketosteroid isomerase-like protein
MPDIDELAGVLAAALEGRDPAAFEAALAPGSVIWHNHDRKVISAIDNMGAVAMLAQLVTDPKCETTYLAPTPDGFVFAYVVRGTVASNGKPFEMHNCIIATTNEGLYTRLDEYVDPTVGAQLT